MARGLAPACGGSTADLRAITFADESEIPFRPPPPSLCLAWPLRGHCLRIGGPPNPVFSCGKGPFQAPGLGVSISYANRYSLPSSLFPRPPLVQLGQIGGSRQVDNQSPGLRDG